MSNSDIAELLKRAGLPAKDSYIQILALFAASPGKSLTATDVYRHLITNEPAVNVTSIYRIVRNLHAAALLDCDKGSGGYGGGKKHVSFCRENTRCRKDAQQARLALQLRACATSASFLLQCA